MELIPLKYSLCQSWLIPRLNFGRNDIVLVLVLSTIPSTIKECEIQMQSISRNPCCFRKHGKTPRNRNEGSRPIHLWLFYWLVLQLHMGANGKFEKVKDSLFRQVVQRKWGIFQVKKQKIEKFTTLFYFEHRIIQAQTIQRLESKYNEYEVKYCFLNPNVFF